MAGLDLLGWHRVVGPTYVSIGLYSDPPNGPQKKLLTTSVQEYQHCYPLFHRYSGGKFLPTLTGKELTEE